MPSKINPKRVWGNCKDINNDWWYCKISTSISILYEWILTHGWLEITSKHIYISLLHKGEHWNMRIPRHLNHYILHRNWDPGHLMQLLTHCPWTKLLPFHRQQFQMHFCEWKYLYFDWKFLPKGSNDINSVLVYKMAWHQMGIITWLAWLSL